MERKQKIKNAKVVYLILAKDGSVKVGVTKNPGQRMQAIKTGSGKPFSWVWTTDPCSNAGAIETRMKKHYASKNICGEWFDIDYNEAQERLKRYFREMAQFEEDDEDGCDISDLVDFATGYTKTINHKALERVRTDEEIGRIETVFVFLNHYGYERFDETRDIVTAVFKNFCGIAFERLGISDASQLFNLCPEELDELWILECAISEIMLRGMLQEKSCLEIYKEARTALLESE